MPHSITEVFALAHCNCSCFAVGLRSPQFVLGEMRTLLWWCVVRDLSAQRLKPPIRTCCNSQSVESAWATPPIMRKLCACKPIPPRFGWTYKTGTPTRPSPGQEARRWMILHTSTCYLTSLRQSQQSLPSTYKTPLCLACRSTAVCTNTFC